MPKEGTYRRDVLQETSKGTFCKHKQRWLQRQYSWLRFGKRPGRIEPRYLFSAALNQIPPEPHDPIDKISISSDHNCDNMELPWATIINKVSTMDDSIHSVIKNNVHAITCANARSSEFLREA